MQRLKYRRHVFELRKEEARNNENLKKQQRQNLKQQFENGI